MDKTAKSVAINKVLDAPVLSMEEFKKRMKPGDILFQSRIKNLDAGPVPYISSAIIQAGQKAPMMHAAMIGKGKKILDYGTGGVDYIKSGNKRKGFRKLSIKEAISGGRSIAIGRVKGMDKEDRDKATDIFTNLAKKKKFNVKKLFSVGVNRFLNKKVLNQKERGEFCSTIVDKAIDQIRIKGIATPADLIENKKVEIIGVFDPLKKAASLKENNMPFKSKDQMKACFAKNDPKWNCKEWSKETPNKESLPENLPEKTAAFLMREIMNGIDKRAAIVPDNVSRKPMDIQKEEFSKLPSGPEVLLRRQKKFQSSSKGGLS